MKTKRYLVIVRCFNEPDNNTPSDEIFVRCANFGIEEAKNAEQIIEDNFMTDGDHTGCEVNLIPLENLRGDWRKVITIW